MRTAREIRELQSLNSKEFQEAERIVSIIESFISLNYKKKSFSVEYELKPKTIEILKDYGFEVTHDTYSAPMTLWKYKDVKLTTISW
ncbi:MAG: hypothetical protein K2M17_05540 [Bacilli bacterium]|nr:hypothetical protein [Bacilli bacterium]